MKISVNLNRIPDLYNIKDDFEVARQYFLKHGINIEWTFKNVDVKGYNSVSVNLPNGSQRYIVNLTQTLVPIGNEDITMFVFDQMEWATPHGSQFPLLPNTPTGNCIPFNGKPFVNISAYIADHNNGQLAIQICHELMHALAQINKVQDVMDTYLINDLRDVPGSNFMNQWALLGKRIVTLHRFSDDGVQALGDLTYGSFTCKTLERPYLENKPNISSIPIGQYDVIWSFSPRLLRYTYEVLNVPNRAGIRFHKGNYFFDVDGCILLGTGYTDLNHDKWADIANTTITIKKFEQIMEKKPFTLIIS